MKKRDQWDPIVFLAWILLLIIQFSGTVLADAREINPAAKERWKLELGAFSQDARMNISAGSNDTVPESVDLNSLGANENANSLSLAARWRINPRWHVGLSYVEVDRQGFAESADDFVFGEPPEEVNVSIGATVNSSFNTKYYILQGGYSLVNSGKANMGIGMGLHVMEMTASISAAVIVDGQTNDLGTGSSNSTVPLPNVYIYSDYSFTPKIAASGNLGWFGVKVDQYDGELIAINANLEYRSTKNFGFGIGYSHVHLDLNIDETDGSLGFEIDASGPRIYVIASFGSVP